MIAIGIILYFLLSLLAGLCGMTRRMGFIGTFLMAVILTPPLTLIILLLTGPSQRYLNNSR